MTRRGTANADAILAPLTFLDRDEAGDLYRRKAQGAVPGWGKCGCGLTGTVRRGKGWVCPHCLHRERDLASPLLLPG